AVGEDGLERHAVGLPEEAPHLVLRRLAPASVVEPEGELHAQRIGDREVAREVFLGLGPSADREEVDDLDEEARAAVALLPHRIDEPGEPREEAVVADPEEGAARDITDARRLHDEDPWLALGEARGPASSPGSACRSTRGTRRRSP